MKINEYVELLEKDNNVCWDIDEHIAGYSMKHYATIEELLEDAEDVICKYRAFVCKIVGKADIEDCFRKKVRNEKTNKNEVG